jgi:hypothetical protein
LKSQIRPVAHARQVRRNLLILVTFYIADYMQIPTCRE